MIIKKLLNVEIREYKRCGVLSNLLFNYLNEMIEVCVSSYGVDLEREDAIQDCWFFILSITKKINTKKNSYAYIHTCLRHHICHLRKKEYKHNHINFEEMGEI